MVVVEVNGYTIEPAANLEWANLEWARLTGVNLVGARLTGANLTGVNLEGATANEGTVWPEGFDPVAAGVIFG